jgi:hypothetical protein
VGGEQIDTGGRVGEMGNAFVQKYGTSYVLRDEVADEALYVLLADDDRTRERIKDHGGFASESGARSCPRRQETT